MSETNRAEAKNRPGNWLPSRVCGHERQRESSPATMFYADKSYRAVDDVKLRCVRPAGHDGKHGTRYITRSYVGHGLSMECDNSAYWEDTP